MAKTEKRTLNIRALLVDEMSKQLTDIRKSVEKTGKQIEKGNKKNAASFKKVAKVVKLLVGAFVALKAVQAFRNLAQTTDQIGKLAIASGDTVEAISLLSNAFQSAGGNAESFRSVLSSLLSSQKGALAGSKEQTNAFRALGFSMAELRKMSPSMMLTQMAEGFGKIESATERTQILATMFPDQWRNVINLIDGGGDMFQKRLKDAAEAGALVTKGQVAAAAEINDAWLRLETAIESVGRALMTDFAPVAIQFLNQLAKLLLENKGLIQDVVRAIGRGILMALDLVSEALIQIVEFLEDWGVIKMEVPSPQMESLERAATALLNIQSLINDVREEGPIVPELAQELDRATEAYRKAKQLVVSGELIGQPRTVSLSARLRMGKEDIANEYRKLQEKFSEAAKSGTPITIDVKKVIKLDVPEKPFIDWTNVKAGWTEGMGALKSQAEEFDRELGKGLAKTVTATFDNFASGLAGVIDGTKSAKDAWKDFARSTLALIAQLIAKMAALKITQAILGVEEGGVLPGVEENPSLPVRPFARGGIARTPQLAVFGEGKQAEAFVPLPDNRSIPVSFTGGQGVGGQQVNVNIYAWDSKDAARGLIENRSVLQSIFTQQADNQVGMRQTLQRAVT